MSSSPHHHQLLDRFQGCLAGSLIGDSFGYEYEKVGGRNPKPTPLAIINERINSIVSSPAPLSKLKYYTDDTSMTISVARFLSEGKTDYLDLIKSFVQVFENEPRNRSYGPGMRRLFPALRKSNFQNYSETATTIFEGGGSFGNGAGMRAAPIALFTISDKTLNRLVDITINATQLTHTHPKGLVGALFQVLAVRNALLAGVSKTPLTASDILRNFEQEFKLIQTHFSHIGRIGEGFGIYEQKLGTIHELLEGGWNLFKVRTGLKTTASGPDSIPTAFFCFLAAFEEMPQVSVPNQFERTIELCFSLGGDTDTIGSMAGAICGAYVGREGIAPNLIQSCESHELILDLAQKLHQRQDEELTQSQK